MAYTLRDLADMSIMHLELAEKAWNENDPFTAQAHALTSLAATAARTSGTPAQREPSAPAR